MRKIQVHEIDHEVQPKNWLHTADSFRITEQQDENPIQIFTDVSKSEHVVRAGIAIFIQSYLVHQLWYALHNRFSNEQPEQLAIVKAVDTIKK